MGSLDELDVVDLPVTILVNAVERSRDPSAELISLGDCCALQRRAGQLLRCDLPVR